MQKVFLRDVFVFLIPLLLHHSLHQRSVRKHAGPLRLDQISPKLAALKDTTIPIPGHDGYKCNIHSIDNKVFVLPTKTKPKKLVFVGSNGRKYTYLFKGD